MRNDSAIARRPRAGRTDPLWLPCWTLWRRDMVRFLRQRSRITGAFATPLVFWLLMGAGLGRSMALPGSSDNYLQFSFAGAVAAIILFTAIFSTISIIEDRQAGFMQGVLVAPVPRLAIALGKVLGTTTLAVGQSLVFLLLAPLAGLKLSIGSVILSSGAMILLSISLSSLGFWIAWHMESSQGFHAIMNLLLMPMLVLSGAFFPPDGSHPWMQWVITLNPMTYGVGLLRACLPTHGGEAVEWARPLVVSLAFAVIMFALLIRSLARETHRSLH